MAEVPVVLRARAELELRRRRAQRLGVDRLAGVVVMPLWDDPPPPPEGLEDVVAFTAATDATARRRAARAVLAGILVERQREGGA